MRPRAGFLFVGALVAMACSAAVTSVVAQNRLADPTPTPHAGSAKVNETSLPIVCISDEALYGVCKASAKQRRLGETFDVIIVPRTNASVKVTYTILVDGVAMRLAGGVTTANTTRPVVETLKAPQIRRANIVIEVTIGGTKTTLDYGPFRFLSAAQVAEAENETPSTPFQEQLIIITHAQMTSRYLKWALAGMVAIVGAAIAAVAWGRGQQDARRPRIIAT